MSISGFLDDPRSGLAEVLTGPGRLLLSGFMPFHNAGHSFAVFRLLSGLFGFGVFAHGNSMTHSGCQSERGVDSNCTTTKRSPHFRQVAVCQFHSWPFSIIASQSWRVMALYCLRVMGLYSCGMGSGFMGSGSAGWPIGCFTGCGSW